MDVRLNRREQVGSYWRALPAFLFELAIGLLFFFLRDLPGGGTVRLNVTSVQRVRISRLE